MKLLRHVAETPGRKHRPVVQKQATLPYATEAKIQAKWLRVLLCTDILSLGKGVCCCLYGQVGQCQAPAYPDCNPLG